VIVWVIAMFVLWNAASAQTPLPAPSQHAASSSPKASQAGSRLEPPPTAMPFVHDPSTVLQYHGKYYVYTTGPGIPMLSSPDQFHWTRLGSVFSQIPERVHAAVPMNMCGLLTSSREGIRFTFTMQFRAGDLFVPSSRWQRTQHSIRQTPPTNGLIEECSWALYDNTKIAVARILGGEERRRTRVFSELQSYYLFADKFGRPAKGNDKGKVEGLVGYARRNFMVPIPRVSSWEELNTRLEAESRKRQIRRLRGHTETIGERFEPRHFVHSSALSCFIPQDCSNGWYFASFLWQIRGFFDLLVGGVGLRRGRRDPHALVAGDALDFWRVESVEPDRRLNLVAVMKVPGRAWLQFEVEPTNDGSMIRQTAIFDPAGLGGLLYWYALYPIHYCIFKGMLHQIAAIAQREPAVASAPA
jgi:hypothetical protein